MNIQTAKREAAAAGLALYWDRQWRCWGLIDPSSFYNEESEWMSSNALRNMTASEFGQRISTMQQKKRLADQRVRTSLFSSPRS